MNKTFKTAIAISCVLAFLLTAIVGEAAAKEGKKKTPKKKDHSEGYVWLTGGAWDSEDNSSYGRNYRDLDSRARISQLELRYFNDRNIEYHVSGLDLGSLNSRYSGVLYLENRFKLDFEGGRISHTTFRGLGFDTQRDWINLSALQDIHRFSTLSLGYFGYERTGLHRYNPFEMSYRSFVLGLNHLRQPWSGRVFIERGEFTHPLVGYDDTGYGLTVGRLFRHDRDHALISYERSELRADGNHDYQLDEHFLSAVYSTSPARDWTLRGAFKANLRDNRTPSAFGVDLRQQGADLDLIYHGFKKIRAKGRISVLDTDRYARGGNSPLPDTKDMTAEIRLSSKGKCAWSWDFHQKFTDRDGDNFRKLDAVRPANLNMLDFYPGNSYKRSKTAFSCSRGFDKNKLMVSLNLQQDVTDYDRNPSVGLDEMQYGTAMLNLLWQANRKLNLGLGAGRTRTEMTAATTVWHAAAPRTREDEYDTTDDVINFNLGYNFSSRTAFAADLMVTRGYSDGMVFPNRFGELEQRYDLEYRCSKSGRIGLRYTDVRYVERIYRQEDGRIRRLDVDYRISF